MATPLHVWQCGSVRFEQKKPLIMGVLNITPDSFSDGGDYLAPTDAIRHARSMQELGADIIDVGGESTRPGSEELSPDEELARVLPIVKTLVDEGFCVAIDSRHPQVVRVCLDEGVSIINDITGFTDPAMQRLAFESNAGCVIMHMKGRPQTMQDNPRYVDVLEEVSDFLLTQAHLLRSGGVENTRICVDPGPGFGKDQEQNLTLLRNTAFLANLEEPPFILMAAWSRKRFIGEITGEAVPSKRVAGSVAAAVYAACHGAGVLRVHDIGPTVEALKVMDALYG